MKKKEKKFGKMGLAVALALGLCSSNVGALPEGPQVTHGNVTITGAGQTLNIDQATQRAIINWNGFSINAGELVRFLQPSQAAAILNRVQGVDPSVINGILQGNGTVMLLNPNGVLIGASGMVNTGSFIGSTLGLSDSDFLSGNLSMSQDRSKNLGAIVNKGKIEVADGGFVVLTSPTISNEGLIIARAGQVSLGTGTQATVNFDGQQLINFAMDFGGDGALLLSQSQTNEVLAQVVNNSGIEEAGTLSNNGSVEAGHVLYQAQGNLNLPGETRTADIVGTTQGDAVLGSHFALDGHNIDISAAGDITFDALVAERLNGQGGLVSLDAGGSISANQGAAGIAGDEVLLVAGLGDIVTPVAANSVSATASNGNVTLQISPGLIDGGGQIHPQVTTDPGGGASPPTSTLQQPGTGEEGVNGTLVGHRGTVLSVRAGGDVNVNSVNTLFLDQVSGRDVNLTSQTGSIADNGDSPGADNRDIISSGNTHLAAAEFLGTLDNPLEVEIGGNLTVLAQREIGGTSGVINGIVGNDFIQDSATVGMVLLNYGNGVPGINQALKGIFENGSTLADDTKLGGARTVNLFYANLTQSTDEDAWMDLLRGTVVWEDEEDEASEF